MLILAIETSCDETAAAIVKDGREVLSNIVATQIDEHKLYGGVVPEISSRRHCENIAAVTEEAFSAAEVSLDRIDRIAVTNEPGLIGSLLVGINFAKGLALAAGKPLVFVNHLHGHIAANYITHKNLEPPYLCLVVSGGNTIIAEISDYTAFSVIGKTLDDAAGEAFDKAARAMGFPYPGGMEIDRIAGEYETLYGTEKLIKFTKPHTENPLDFSFSGLKTAVLNYINSAKQKGEETDIPLLAASFRRTAAEILCDKFISAAKQKGYRKLAISGGVAANSLLREELTRLAAENSFELFLPERCYCGDNAAMIGSQAYFSSGISKL
jgi:N6-L-threonylcarbamoyladenine synthase